MELTRIFRSPGSWLALATIAVASVAAPGLAQADVEIDAAATDQMTLPTGAVLITADLEIGLNKDAAFKPLSLSPDIWYGVNDKLTLGLVHSARGLTGFVGGQGDALCLSGKDNGCASIYDAVALDARYAVTAGKFGITLDGALAARSFDPFALGLKIGAIGHLRAGKIGLDIAPSIMFGLNERDAGNKETFFMPVSVQLGAHKKVALSLQSGIRTPFSNAGDLFTIPLSLGASFAVSPKFFASLAFSFPALIGGSAIPDGVDIKTLTIGGGYAL